jgi:hypothetical protein
MSSRLFLSALGFAVFTLLPTNHTSAASDQGRLETAMTLARAHFKAPNGPGQRFRRLLGKDGYNRLLEVAESEVRATLNGTTLPDVPGELKRIAHDTVAASLNQDRFARPFDVIALTPPKPGDVAVARHAAADAIISVLGTRDLEDTSVGATYDALIDGTNEEPWLADVDAWRRSGSDTVRVVTLSHAWIFTGPALGIQTDVTVSRTTGAVLGVVLELD